MALWPGVSGYDCSPQLHIGFGFASQEMCYHYPPPNLEELMEKSKWFNIPDICTYVDTE